MTVQRVYLDNAATSWPKPASVPEAIAGWYQMQGGGAGRGVYRSALEATALLDQCRRAIGTLAGAGSSAHVVLTRGGTDSLNLAIHGMLRPGGHVLATTLEHNSVLRPLFAARDEAGVGLELLCPADDGRIQPDSLLRSLRSDTQLVCLTHASNVTGAVQDVAAISRICRDAGVPLLVDASQTAGREPLCFDSWDCDLLAATGHKGLFGPLGTGFLIVGSRVADAIRPSRQGGTGGDSLSERQPDGLPARLECGSHDVAGVAGLLQGIGFVLATGVQQIARHERELAALMREELAGLPEVEQAGPGSDSSLAISSLILPGQDPHVVASILDASFGFEVRSGFHCAPRAVQRGGQAVPTLRISPGWFNTAGQIRDFTAALRAILAG